MVTDSAAESAEDNRLLRRELVERVVFIHFIITRVETQLYLVVSLISHVFLVGFCRAVSITKLLETTTPRNVLKHQMRQ